MDSFLGFLLVATILGVAAWWATKKHHADQLVITDAATKRTDNDLKDLQMCGYGMMKIHSKNDTVTSSSLSNVRRLLHHRAT